MAYDLILRRQVSRNYARGQALQPSRKSVAIGLLGLMTAGALTIVPYVIRQREIERYRREFGDGLDVTQELPAMTMHDLIYSGDSKS